MMLEVKDLPPNRIDEVVDVQRTKRSSHDAIFCSKFGDGSLAFDALRRQRLSAWSHSE
jgi:hypothetical protein